MIHSSVEDKLRHEYFELLPEIQIVAEELETRTRYAVLDVVVNREDYDLIAFKARVKECESAINAVRRRQEGKLFDDSLKDTYTLTSLRDLAGVRVLVFPSSKIDNIVTLLNETFDDWKSDPVQDDSDPPKLVAHKYFGYCHSSNRVMAEYQVVPMLIGQFWDVEHSALYKPAPQLEKIARELKMQQQKEKVYNALTEFVDEFEGILHEVSGDK